MAEASWPFEGQDTTEAQFSAWASALVDTGVLTGLDLSAGSGMTVEVAPGVAFVRGFYYELTVDPKVLSVGAAPGAGQTRRDYIILQLDLTADTIVAAVKAGTATSGGGTLPSLTQDASVWEIPLGVVTIAAGTISLSAGNIAQGRSPIGIRVLPYANEAARPTPATRALGVNVATRRLELFEAGVWYGLTPDVTWASVTGKPSTFPPDAHSHTWDSVTGKPSTFPATAHTHDDRYFTEAEVASLLAGKSDTGHAHSWSEITSKPSTFTPSSHSHSAADITTGTLTRPVLTTGSGRFGAAWNNDVSGVTRRSVWMDSAGTLGHSPSSRRYKTNIEPTALSADVARLIEVVDFEYIANPGPVDTGVIAEQIDDLGLEFLIDRNVDGSVEGVHYDRLAVAALKLAQSQADRLDEIEGRLTAAGL